MGIDSMYQVMMLRFFALLLLPDGFKKIFEIN